MSYQFLLFEAKSIQSYLLEANKVKQLIGASALVDNLMEGFLDSVLETFDLNKDSRSDIHFIRRAGGAFYAWTYQADKLKPFVELWPLLIAQYAPGLKFVWTVHNPESDNFKEGLDESFKAHHINNATQNSKPLPQFTSIMLRDNLTGRAAVIKNDVTKELQDSVSAWRSKKGGRTGGKGTTQKMTSLEEKITPDEAKTTSQWAEDIGDQDSEGKTTIATDRNIAVIHIDGNGFGQLMIDLRKMIEKLDDKDYTRLFRAFSSSIQEATIKAVKSVIANVYLNKGDGLIRIRPIVIGGDDITLLVPAEHAMEISQTFLRKFEIETKEAIETFKKMLKPMLKSQNSNNSGPSTSDIEKKYEIEVGKNPQKYQTEGQQKNLLKKIRKKLKQQLKLEAAEAPGSASVSNQLETLPPKLTACGAIVYIKSQQPFYKAYQICESLCSDVKRQMKSSVNSDTNKYYSALGFHRITDSSLSDYSELDQLQNHRFIGSQDYGFSLGAYSIEDGKPLPDIEKLQSLTDFIRNSEADFAQLLRFNAGETVNDYELRKNAFIRRQEALPSRKENLDKFNQKLKQLYGKEGYFKQVNNLLKSPIRDIEALLAADNSREKKQTSTAESHKQGELA